VSVLSFASPSFSTSKADADFSELLAIREYVVIPLLDQDTTTAPSIHTNNVLASAISGTVVGGAMSSYFRECYPFARKDYKKLLTLEATGGPQKFVSGSTTFGILSTSLQLLGNELRVLRVQYLAGRDSAGKSPDVSVDSPAPSLRNKTEKLPQLPVDSPPQPLPTTPKASSQTEQPSSWLQKAGSYLSALSPVRQISDEDYYEQLKARRRQVVEKLSEVDSIIGSEKGTQAQHKVYHSMQ
jgi:hypothetical protein